MTRRMAEAAVYLGLAAVLCVAAVWLVVEAAELVEALADRLGAAAAWALAGR